MAGRSADTSAPWRRAVAQVIVGELGTPTLADEDLHHLGRALRLRPGAEICASDGAGSWRFASYTGEATLEPTGEIEFHARRGPELTVAFAPVKGDRPELVVQKLSEIGIDRIVPLQAARSVVRWDAERSAKQFNRLRRVAREACCQSRRLWLPELGIAGSEDSVVATTQMWADTKVGVVVAEPGGRALGPEDVTVLIGPEGGWDSKELSEASEAGIAEVSVGNHVLRAETAAIAAGVLMCALRVDF